MITPSSVIPSVCSHCADNPPSLVRTVHPSFSSVSQAKLPVVIIECGMGGALDATNIFDPILSIINFVLLDRSVSYDTSEGNWSGTRLYRLYN